MKSRNQLPAKADFLVKIEHGKIATHKRRFQGKSFTIMPILQKQFLSITLAIACLLLLFTFVWPFGIDYFAFYRPVTTKFMLGQTILYDNNSRGFHNAPWTLLIFLPTIYLPPVLGKASLNLFVLFSFIGCVHLTTRDLTPKVSPQIVLVALSNLPVVAVLLDGQVDGLIIYGVVLGYYAIKQHKPYHLSLALWLMAIKPNNVLLPLVLFGYQVIRTWTVKSQLIALSLPLISFIMSLFMCGFDLPLRYLDNLYIHPPYNHIALWQFVPPLFFNTIVLTSLLFWGICVYYDPLSTYTLVLSLTINLTIGIYTTSNHYSLLIPSLIYVTTFMPIVGYLAYLSSLLPMTRTYLIPIYPLIILFGLLIIRLRSSQEPTKHNQSSF